MSKGAEKLSERLHTVEFHNQNLLKIYNRITDKVSFQEDNMHAIQIMFKDETLSLLDEFHTLKSYVQNKVQKLNESMRALEQHTGLESQMLQQAVVKRFEMVEEIIRTDQQGGKVKEQDLYSPIQVKVKDDLPRILSAYLVISFEKPSGTKYPKVVKQYKWQPTGMSNLKEIKYAIVSYSFHSPFVREMVKIWASRNKATLNAWLQLVSAILEDGHQLLWKCYLREEAKILEQQREA